MQEEDNKTTELMRQELWETYWQERDMDLRNQLAVEYMSIVRYYVYHLRSTYENHAEADEMISQGSIALLEAIEKYDPSYHTKFTSYASAKVKGAIIDYVRQQDWRPKRVKMESKQYGEAVESLSNQLGRVPTNEEVADYLDIPVKKVEQIQGEVYTFNLLSYEDLLEQGIYGAKGYRDPGEEQGVMPEREMQSEEMKEMLSRYLETLPEKERLVLTLYYYEELKLKEIAYVLDISPSRVSQLHNAALQKMKEKLKAYLSEEE